MGEAPWKWGVGVGGGILALGNRQVTKGRKLMIRNLSSEGRGGDGIDR